MTPAEDANSDGCFLLGAFRDKILLIQKILNPFMGYIITLFALFFLTGKFFELIKDYKARYLGIGQVDPNFKVFYEG